MTIKKVWLILAVTCLITIPVRTWQLLVFVDNDTGFFTDGGLTAAIVTVVLAVSCVVIAVFCHRGRELPESSRQPGGTPLAVLCLMTAAAMIVQSLAKLVEVAGPSSAEVLEPGLEPVTTRHPFLYSSLAVLCVFAALVMVMAAVGYARRSNPFGGVPLLALALPLWGCLDLAVMFVNFTEVVNTIESVYDMFMVIFLLLCLFAQAQFFVGIDEEKTRRWMLADTFCFSVVALTVTVPNILMYLLGRGDICSLSLESSVVYFLMSLYLQSFLFAVCFRHPRHLKKSEREQAADGISK